MGPGSEVTFFLAATSDSTLSIPNLSKKFSISVIALFDYLVIEILCTFISPVKKSYINYKLRCLLNIIIQFFIWISENGQILASEHHFEITEDPIFCPNIWKWPEFSLRTILLRYPGTYFFIRTFEISQSLALEYNFEVSKKLIFPSDVFLSQSLVSE